MVIIIEDKMPGRRENEGQYCPGREVMKKKGSNAWVGE
jgi:hypothetical protein